MWVLKRNGLITGLGIGISWLMIQDHFLSDFLESSNRIFIINLSWQYWHQVFINDEEKFPEKMLTHI